MTKKRGYKTAGLICVLLVALIFWYSGLSKTTSVSNDTYNRSRSIATVNDAKKLLDDGNRRFVSGKVLNDDLSEAKRKDLSENGQHPFAIIISCSDSRVPPEIIFDQALGDLFIIRVAGNVVDPVILGSIEYGAEHLQASLIVVLGHEKCGAVKATVDGDEVSGSIMSIVEKIKPAYNTVKPTTTDTNELYEKCTDENVKNTIAEIRKSSVIRHLEAEKMLEIVGAKYDVDTGVIENY